MLSLNLYRIFGLGLILLLGFHQASDIIAPDFIINRIINGPNTERRLKQEKFSSVEQEGLLNLFIASNYLHSKLDAICCGFKITLAQFNVLRILKGAHPEGYPRGEIIRRMVEPAPDVTR